VSGKWAIPRDENGEVDAPAVLEVVGENGLLVATDSGRLELRDLREGDGVQTNGAGMGGTGKGKGLAGVWRPHDTEHVNDLLLLPASETSTSGIPKVCVSVGGTTLAVTDFRKGVVAKSEDQEVELTSITLVDGLKKGGTSVGEKVLVGQSDGVVSLWERGVWGDIDERIVVDRGGSGVESLVEVPAGMALGKGNTKMSEKIVAAGLEDGRVRFVRIGRNAVLQEWDVKHDDIEGVVGLGFDVAGRLVSGGGQTVKVWTEAVGEPGGGRGGINDGVGKRSLDVEDDENSDEEDDSENEDEDSSDDEREKSKRKKRKRNKGKDKSGGHVLQFSGIL
jgi:WD repeat-containing protein 55